MEKLLKTPETGEEGELDLSEFIILDGRIGSYPDIYLAKYRTNFGSDQYDAHKALHETNSTLFMTTPRMLIDLISDLESGKQLYNGLGNRISSKESKQILDEIVGIRNPIRGERLDASFRIVGKHIFIDYNHRFVDGELKPQSSEPLEDCLMENCYVDILSANRQGLPTRRYNNGVYYIYPRDVTVARFGAISGKVGLYCVWDYRYSDPALGVRRAKIKER